MKNKWQCAETKRPILSSGERDTIRFSFPQDQHIDAGYCYGANVAALQIIAEMENRFFEVYEKNGEKHLRMKHKEEMWEHSDYLFLDEIRTRYLNANPWTRR